MTSEPGDSPPPLPQGANGGVHIYQRLVEANPDDAVAWHNLGLAEASCGRQQIAIGYLTRAVDLCPDAAAYRANLALAYGLAGDWQRAAEEYRRAVELRPHHAASLAKFGRALARTGELSEAIQWIERAAAAEPCADHANALGAALAQDGQIEAAAQAFAQALQMDEGHEEAQQNLLRLAECAAERGAAQAAGQAWAEASDCFARAAHLAQLGSAPSAIHYFHLGVAQAAMGDLPQARRSYQTAVSLDARYSEAWNNMAHVELALGNGDGALELARKAIECRPDYVEARYNLGVILQSLDRLEEAAGAYRRVLALEPSHADALNNLGSLELAANALTTAEEYFDRAIRNQPEHLEARWNRALTLLAGGRWQEGWQAYEVRLQRPEYNRQFGGARWRGEALSGRSLLLWAEQGLGDTLQFLRYAQALARDGEIWMECQPRLLPLLALSGLNVVAKGDTASGYAPPATDFEIPLMSLPGLVGAGLVGGPGGIPAPWPKIELPMDRLAVWEAMVGSTLGAKEDRSASMRAGLVWGAQQANVAGRARSMPLPVLEPLSRIDGMQLVSLQHGPQAAVARECRWLTQFDEPVGDIVDTAALMRQLDLVITVDTMAAHLAGLLGIPVWMLVPFSADWRWMQIGQQQTGEQRLGEAGPGRTLWYESMKIWRQTARGDWEGVVERVAAALARERAESFR